MLDSTHGRGCLSQSLSLLAASCRERHDVRRQSASCRLSDVGRVTFQPSDALQQVCVHQPSHAQPRGSSWRNRFAANPCPADFVTLPVSVSHRRFGSFSLAAEKRQALYCKIIEHCIPDMLKQRTSIKAGYVGWAYGRFRRLAKTCWSA
jgi:hypothetical protein